MDRGKKEREVSSVSAFLTSWWWSWHCSGSRRPALCLSLSLSLCLLSSIFSFSPLSWSVLRRAVRERWRRRKITRGLIELCLKFKVYLLNRNLWLKLVLSLTFDLHAALLLVWSHTERPLQYQMNHLFMYFLLLYSFITENHRVASLFTGWQVLSSKIGFLTDCLSDTYQRSLENKYYKNKMC